MRAAVKCRLSVWLALKADLLYVQGHFAIWRNKNFNSGLKRNCKNITIMYLNACVVLVSSAVYVPVGWKPCKRDGQVRGDKGEEGREGGGDDASVCCSAMQGSDHPPGSQGLASCQPRTRSPSRVIWSSGDGTDGRLQMCECTRCTGTVMHAAESCLPTRTHILVKIF